MAIGYGTGENKALKAVKQALDHPLLETVSLHRAAGVIANFTASNEMTLLEVSEALIYLQDQSNPDTEVVMGTTPKEHMGDKVQVNLVVTGLGATTLEEVLPGAERLHQRPRMPEPEKAPQPEQRQEKIITSIPSITSSELDIPAFLRKQSRYVS